MSWVLCLSNVLGYCFTKLSSVLHSASKQHISGGREHSGPIQSIPSPEFYSRLHCKRRETSPIGELLLKIHHAARPPGTCLYSTQIPVVYRGKETVFACCCRGFSFVCGSFFFEDIRSQTISSKKGPLNRIPRVAWQQHNPWSQCIPDIQLYFLTKKKYWWIQVVYIQRHTRTHR